nr:hypothetical protein [Tanacetum cinerariifolium]
MPYYPNFKNPLANHEEQMLFNQWKMQMQYNQFSQQQQPNQATTSQPQYDQQSFHLQDEDDEEKDEAVPTPTSKKQKEGVSHKWRRKEKNRKPKGHELDICGAKARSYFWRKVSFKYTRIQKLVQIKQMIFWYKILDVYNEEAKKHGYTYRIKNMLMGKCTLMNRDV